MVDISAKAELESGTRKTLEKDLLGLHKQLQGTLDMTSKLKITGIDPNMKVIDSEKSEKLRQETMGKFINKYLTAQKNNNPADAYLNKIKKKEKVEIDFDILAFLNANKKDEASRVEEVEPKNSESIDLTLDRTLKEKVSNVHGEEADETQFIGVTVDKKQHPPKENEVSSIDDGNGEGPGPVGFSGGFFSVFPQKLPTQNQEEQPLKVPYGQNNEQPSKPFSFNAAFSMPGGKLPTIQEHPKELGPFKPDAEEEYEEIQSDKTQQQPKQQELKIPVKIALGMLRDSLRTGYFESASAHYKKTGRGFNPFLDSHIHTSLPEEGEKYANPFKLEKKQLKPKKPKIVVEFYEEEEIEDCDVRFDDNLTPVHHINQSINPHLLTFSNPFKPQSRSAKKQVNPSKVEKDVQVFAEDNFTLGDSKVQKSQPEAKQRKRNAEKEVRSGYDPDGPNDQIGRGKGKEALTRNQNSGINNLKDWMAQRNVDEGSQEQDNLRQKNARYNSWLKMKGMETTNSDLDTILRCDKNFEWNPPENIAPLMMSRNYNENPIIIEEEQEKSAVYQNSSNKHGPQRAVRQEANLDEEQGGRILNVKSTLPGWYGEDPDTDLYENMYMVDAVRYNNFKLTHQPGMQSPDRNTIRSKNQPNYANRDAAYESPPNLSYKLESNRGLQKSDKRIPKVICFVTKYHGGNLEDDEDGSDFVPQLDKTDLKKSHPSPYFEVSHQNAFRSGSNPLKNSNYGLRQPITNVVEDDGYFDVSKYKLNQARWSGNYVSDAAEEEDEGVRQSVRTSARVSNKRF